MLAVRRLESPGAEELEDSGMEALKYSGFEMFGVWLGDPGVEELGNSDTGLLGPDMSVEESGIVALVCPGTG